MGTTTSQQKPPQSPRETMIREVIHDLRGVINDLKQMGTGTSHQEQELTPSETIPTETMIHDVIRELERIIPTLEWINTKCMEDERLPVITNGELVITELKKHLCELQTLIRD
uniref:Uncharacterized protein n=1 Tax=viral metagenome TaxID=1070528 RepID=A0A6C0CKT1_9ZZZZ